MIKFIISIFLISLAVTSCVHQPVQQKKEQRFRLVPFKKNFKPLAGKNFSVRPRLEWEQFSAPVQGVVSQIKKHYMNSGMTFVDDIKKAHLVISVGVDQYKEKYEGVDLGVGRLFIIGSRQEYATRPVHIYESYALYYVSSKPSPQDVTTAYWKLLEDVTSVSTTYTKGVSKKDPGCMPVFGYRYEENARQQIVVKAVSPKMPFSKSKIKVGDVVLAVNGEQLAVSNDKYYDLKKGARFVFLRDGKSFEKVIKPEIHCVPWEDR